MGTRFLSPAAHPSPCVSLHALRLCAPASRRSARLPHSLAPPRCDLRRGGGKGGSHRSLRPCAHLQPVRTPVYSPSAGDFTLTPLCPAQTPPARGQECPSHPAGAEASWTPERQAGKVGVGLPAGYRGGRYKSEVLGKGTMVLSEPVKASLVHRMTTLSQPKMHSAFRISQGGLFLLERKITLSQAPRSLISQTPQAAARPSAPFGPSALSQVPGPFPHLYVHTRASALGLISLFLPVR